LVTIARLRRNSNSLLTKKNNSGDSLGAKIKVVEAIHSDRKKK
jgi:hypothetical protein